MGARDKSHHTQPKLSQAAETPNTTTCTALLLQQGEPSAEECRWRPADPKGGQTTREIQNLPAKTKGNVLNTADKTFRCSVENYRGVERAAALLSWGEACAAALLGSLTCSNKPPSSSRVNLATAGCLDSLPGKKTRESACIALNRCRGQACSSVSTNPNPCEYQTCCDMQLKHVWGCSTPLLQAFQSHPGSQSHPLWLWASRA